MIDLHAHLPMYWPPPLRDRPAGVPRGAHARAVVRHAITRDAGRRGGNYVAGSGAPRVSIPSLRAGGFDAALAVLHSAFDEVAFPIGDWRRLRGLPTRLRLARAGTTPAPVATLSSALAALIADKPPSPRAFRRLLNDLEAAERVVERGHRDEAAYARSPEDLEAIRESGRLALVHSVEGGFHLPPDPADVGPAVEELARRGVASLTIAHLLYRSVATVAPAIPYFSDQLADQLYPQPPTGLTERARAAVRATVEHGLLLDTAHMSDAALDDTFALLDELDPAREVPVVASHVGVRLGAQRYNVEARTVERVAARGGVVGLIASEHQLADGAEAAPRGFDDSMQLLFRHIDALREITGSHRHTAIGTDLGGFIEPLPGLETAAAFGAVRERVERRYGSETAALIARGNASRVLLGQWGRRRVPAP